MDAILIESRSFSPVCELLCVGVVYNSKIGLFSVHRLTGCLVADKREILDYTSGFCVVDKAALVVGDFFKVSFDWSGRPFLTFGRFIRHSFKARGVINLVQLSVLLLIDTLRSFEKSRSQTTSPLVTIHSDIAVEPPVPLPQVFCEFSKCDFSKTRQAS